MLIPAMGVKLIVTVESLPTKATFRMTFETALVNGSRIVIAEFLMLAKLLLSEEFMLMGEHLLVPGAEVAHNLVVHAFDMPMQVWPAPAGNIAVFIRTIVAQQDKGVNEYVLFLVFNAQSLI